MSEAEAAIAPFAANFAMFPWVAGLIAFVAMVGLVTVIDMGPMLWRERRTYPFRHPLTQHKLSMFLVGLTFFLGTAPDAAYLLTFGEVSRETSASIRRADLLLDGAVGPCAMAWACVVLASRWRWRNALSRACFGAGSSLYWQIDTPQPGSSEIPTDAGDCSAEPRARIAPLPGFDWPMARLRLSAITGLSLLACVAVWLNGG